MQHRCLVLVAFLVGLASSRQAMAQWEAIGPYGGHAQIISIDPADANHLYAAAKKGQIRDQSSGSAGRMFIGWDPVDCPVWSEVAPSAR